MIRPTVLALGPRSGGLPWGRITSVRRLALCSKDSTPIQCVRRGLSSSALDLSYTRGPDDPPLLSQTIPEQFSSVVSKFGDRAAVISRSPTTADALMEATTSTLTFSQLDSLSNTLAHSLRSLGVKKGDRVAISLGNVPEYVALNYAIFKLGAILVPLNPSFNAQQLGSALSHLGVEVLITGALTDLAYKPRRGRSNLPILKSIVPSLDTKIESEMVPTLKKVIILDNTPFHPLADFKPADYRSLVSYTSLLEASSQSVKPDSPLHPDETINIQFTSGTTSTPKAAQLTHHSILNNGYLIASRMGLDPTDKIVCPPPLFHCFGSVLGLMATATTGAAMLYASPAFDPAASLMMVAEQRASGLYGVATMFVAEMELLYNPAFAAKVCKAAAKSTGLNEGAVEAIDPKKLAFANLRKGIAAGSSVPESLMRKIYDKLGLEDLVICYGMTETSPVSCMTTPNDPFAKRTSSVGRAMPHTAVKIVSPHDRDEIVPIGEKGELAAAGYLVMQGYWDDAERTAEVRIADEEGTIWMYSGDEAVMDEAGYVQITGRIKDLVIRAGENIHPLEIEDCIFQMQQVQEVSVVGVPDEKLGESVGAFVVPRHGVRTSDTHDWDELKGKENGDGEDILTKEKVREWVRGRLSSHLVPKYVWWVDEYPKTASGKIQKYKLRDLATKLLETENK